MLVVGTDELPLPSSDSTPPLAIFSRVMAAVPSSVGSSAAWLMPSCARLSCSRTPATCTSRLAAATRRSSPVSSSSWNSAHQFGSTGASVGTLGAGCLGAGGGGLWPVSQEPIDQCGVGRW